MPKAAVRQGKAIDLRRLVAGRPGNDSAGAAQEIAFVVVLQYLAIYG